MSSRTLSLSLHSNPIMSATTSGAAASRPPPQQEEEEKEETLIPSLPNDISINILARIPRSHHPILSLVSKPFRSLLSSPYYYATRTALPSSEPTLYLCIRLPTSASSALRWFALHHNSPNPKNPPHFLVQLPPTPSPLLGSAFVSVGPKVYVIGGSINDVPSSRVWALDCRFNTWESVPGMRVPREFAAAGVVDGLVYVVGGCVVDTWARSKNWAEVFDPVAMRWDAVDSEVEGLMREKWMHASAVINGRIYAMADRNGVVYEPRMKRWGSVEKRLDLGWRGRACVVDEVLYCYDYVGKIQGFDVRIGAWRELRGLGKELPKFLCGATMANVGGKLVVVWEGNKGSGKEMEIWCAEIEVEKKGEGELLGKVVWCDVVHKVPHGSAIVQCLAVTL